MLALYLHLQKPIRNRKRAAADVSFPPHIINFAILIPICIPKSVPKTQSIHNSAFSFILKSVLILVSSEQQGISSNYHTNSIVLVLTNEEQPRYTPPGSEHTGLLDHQPPFVIFNDAPIYGKHSDF